MISLANLYIAIKGLPLSLSFSTFDLHLVIYVRLRMLLFLPVFIVAFFLLMDTRTGKSNTSLHHAFESILIFFLSTYRSIIRIHKSLISVLALNVNIHIPYEMPLNQTEIYSMSITSKCHSPDNCIFFFTSIIFLFNAFNFNDTEGSAIFTCNASLPYSLQHYRSNTRLQYTLTTFI